MGAPARGDTVAAALERHGLSVTEEELARAVEEGMALLDPTAAGLPEPARSLLAGAGLRLEDAAALEDATARSVGSYAALVAASLSVRDTAELLGIAESRVRHRIADRELYALHAPGGARLLPAWQLRDGRPLPGLGTVLRSLPDDLHPLEVLGFFSTVQPELELDGAPATVFDWLCSGGDPRRAAELAGAELL